MVLVNYSDEEELVIRDLAKYYDDGCSQVSINQIAERFEGDEHLARQAIYRLQNYQFLFPADCSNRWEINGYQALEAVNQLDNPPAPDHWEYVVRWFRSKRWSVPVILLLVVVPLLFQWVEMLTGLLGWLMESKAP